MEYKIYTGLQGALEVQQKLSVNPNLNFMWVTDTFKSSRITHIHIKIDTIDSIDTFVLLTDSNFAQIEYVEPISFEGRVRSDPPLNSIQILEY